MTTRRTIGTTGTDSVRRLDIVAQSHRVFLIELNLAVVPSATSPLIIFVCCPHMRDSPQLNRTDTLLAPIRG